jgi:hypothetical protein
MPARLSKRQQRELEELSHADEIEQVGRLSRDEDIPLASASAPSAFAAVSQDALIEITERFTSDKSF